MQKLETRRERIIALVVEINSVRAKLQALEAELDGLLPPERSEQVALPGIAVTKMNGGSRVASATPDADHPRMVPGSIASKIVELLEAHPGKMFSASDIARELGLENTQSMRGTLQRLFKNKTITRPGWGSFQAARAPRREEVTTM